MHLFLRLHHGAKIIIHIFHTKTFCFLERIFYFLHHTERDYIKAGHKYFKSYGCRTAVQVITLRSLEDDDNQIAR